MLKALFLDRDGVINYDKGYVHKKEDFEFIEGIFNFLRHFQEKGFKLFIITNQSGIGRGYYTEKDFYILTDWMKKELLKEKININKVKYCPHTPIDRCVCRKPNIGMLEELIRDYNIDNSNSWLIGDKKSDIQAGKLAKINNTILFQKDNENIPNYNQKFSLSRLDNIKDIFC